ncbi:G2-specific serine/threonine protein kinase [Friedmanniomyces endolithicus]|uniref:non-specific serine/threonine protein kinase n=1 Tax=Friedmanniomyces endolithicus TaxID=329885 RepID=A0AAN6FXT4_9PEZI|nr:G2-specific serine/threonine protein kinase [Friedmanniomyces endolithicus]KAK0288168.1 G2-specific serine/threonine protein kinase [Friedmanniomyces endolithicus]KAK0326299.1 G2-specific serine/threonine protein kinase [Friedmanniomyces endolithicus]KAK0976218.1 G2-specific serine/threonine protein kinase [Friedmanniomyces endolithicus]
MAEEGGGEEQKYDVLQKIGQGSFGIIRKVRRKTDNAILCRKEISYSRMSDREKSQLAAELDILKTLRHPNVVQYYSREHIKTSHDIHLYMEYCGNGDLGGYIKKLRERNVLAEEEFVWSIFAQLVGALYRCHYGEDAPGPGQEAVVRQGKVLQSKVGHRVILHRDLKPENVFLGQNNAVKLGDFGLSKIIASHDFASTYVGTPFYMSPEICAAERYSHHSDVWSLGCIMYELATRNVPFDARSHVELVMKIKAGRIKPLPEVYSRELWDAISWCLKVDPRSRPDTAQLLNVPQIRTARMKLEQVNALDNVNGDKMRLQQERDSAFAKLNTALKQVQELQAEVLTLREAGKKIEREWHIKGNLAIDQRVAEAENKLNAELVRQKAYLQQRFDATVEKEVDEKLKLHHASLPQGHRSGEVASHVRSSTPPPGKSQGSFATTATTGVDSDGSSVGQIQDGTTLDTDLSSLSIVEAEYGAEDVSPLAQRTRPAPKPRARQAFGRAKTLANCIFDSKGTASPMDVHMADPSPMANHVSIEGLSLSPRRHGAGRLSSGLRLRQNIFAAANEQKLRPTMSGEIDSSFADDDDLLDDDPDDFGDSPSRPSSGASNPGVANNGGDPFKALALQQQQQQQLPPPKRAARPSLARQQTMPASMQPGGMHSRQRSNNLFGIPSLKKPTTTTSFPEKEREKENRPPSANAARSGVPVLSALSSSPKRTFPPTTKDGKVLTPSRKAPPPTPAPSGGLPGRANTSSNLAKLAQFGQQLQSPGKAGVKGRTLMELTQAHTAVSQPELVDAQGVPVMGGGVPKLLPLPLPLPSPAKWDGEFLGGDEMPSPFLAKKGRALR